jgi:hypothetical protein
MVINSLYGKYFQKSKIFIYPLLGIKRGGPAIPMETYLSWNNSYNTEDMKFICMYENRKDIEYLKFEKNVLLSHTRLCDYVKIDTERSIFTFDFSDMEIEWNNIISGNYSKLDLNLKRKILDYFDKNGGNYTYVYSYLFPDKWFERYAEILDVPVNLLITVGELCDKPDLEKENLSISIADLQNLEIID